MKIFNRICHSPPILNDTTAQKMKFSIKDFFSKCDQICRKPRIWSQLLQKPLMENFIFCEVYVSSHLMSIYPSQKWCIERQTINFVRHAIESISFVGPNIGDLVSNRAYFRNQKKHLIRSNRESYLVTRVGMILQNMRI